MKSEFIEQSQDWNLLLYISNTALMTVPFEIVYLWVGGGVLRVGGGVVVKFQMELDYLFA